MGRHVTVGRGAVGNGVAEQLRDAGQEVVQINRRGGAVEEARGLSFDATDQEALAAAAARSGADAVYNCANPPYDKWVRSWPTLAASLLHAAERRGACAARGRLDSGAWSPRVGFLRPRCRRHRPARLPGGTAAAPGQDSSGAGRPGHAAHLHPHPRRGMHCCRVRYRWSFLGATVARALGGADHPTRGTESDGAARRCAASQGRPDPGCCAPGDLAGLTVDPRAGRDGLPANLPRRPAQFCGH